jgi:hypothetical protein
LLSQKEVSMREGTMDPKLKPSQAAVEEQPTMPEDLARRIDREFERYREMRDAGDHIVTVRGVGYKFKE